jgi:hypothetical protein
MKPKIFLVTATAILTITFGSIYVIGQQTIRLSANMPQIQIAQDAVRALNNGTKPENVIPAGQKVDLANSSSGFVIIYDLSGKVVAGTGQLNDTIPVIPYGVLQNTKASDYHAVTWQPQNNVRIASIEAKANDYYVLAGRTLTQPEKLVTTIGRLTLLGYVTSLVVLLGGWFVYTKSKPK